MSDKGWKPGFTNGTSEGRWTPVNDTSRMRYEKANPQHYEPPASESFREGMVRIFGEQKRFCEKGHRLAWCDCPEASCPTPSTSS